ncbi:hypothetical protein [Bosea sp. AS-1]|uniref:hypothetical protein n=1 Tax=Bosea sp. AS-1 TaxID=2015316 RepID=UPI0012FDD56F|nr:hypothetical protein [Bosea sp. AS-1]
MAIYELVIGLREHDIRRDKAENAKGEMAVELGRTRRGGGMFPLPNDKPYRDGAHSTWDSEHLGGLPVFVIDPNGKPWVETRPEPCMIQMIPADEAALSKATGGQHV